MSAPIIQARYDDLAAIAARFGEQSEQSAALLHRVKQCADTLTQEGWEGEGVLAFRAEMDDEVFPALQRLIQALQEGRAVTLEASAILRQAEEEAAALFQGTGTDSDAQFTIIPPIFPPLNPWSPTSPEAAFEQKWKGMSVDERLDFLREQYKRICKEYGIAEIKIKQEDLKDEYLIDLPFGIQIGQMKDARGVYRGDEIAIDIDNLRDDKGYNVLKTLIHETRHQIQWEMVQKYNSEGDNAQFPQGITLDQVKSWKENFADYKKSDDDFEAYRKQPVEADARDFEQRFLGYI